MGAAACDSAADPPSPSYQATTIQLPRSRFIDCGDFVSIAQFEVFRTDRWTYGRGGVVVRHVVDVAYRGKISGPATSVPHLGRTTLTYDTAAGTVSVTGLGRRETLAADRLTVHDPPTEVLGFAARDLLRTTGPHQVREADYSELCRALREPSQGFLREGRS